MFLEQHPDVDITYGGVRYFSSEPAGDLLLSRQYSSWEDGGAWMPEISGQGKEVLLALLRNNIMVVNAPLIRREVIDRVGLFDVDLTPVEDWEYLIRCAAHGAVFGFNDVEGARAFSRLIQNYADPLLRAKYTDEVGSAERHADSPSQNLSRTFKSGLERFENTRVDAFGSDGRPV